MPLHRGIQYAAITSKVFGPMSDPAVAERVIAKIAEQMTRGLNTDQVKNAQIAQREDAIKSYEDVIALVSRDDNPHHDTDGTRESIAHFEAEIVELRKQITALQNAPAPKDPVEIAREMVETHCGRYTRGKNEGQLRGWAHIEICTEGGWKKDGPGERNGRVIRPGRVTAIKILDFHGKAFLEVA